MKEKIKIICLALITIGILVSMWIYIQKGMLYLNAYKDCMGLVNLSWKCISILNGGGGQ
jgi:hypothetical protein